MSMSLAATETVPGNNSSIIVKPLSPALGAEILGVDLRQELPAQTIADIIDAWHEHLVIVVRDQTLSEDEQIRFAKHFGALKQRNRPAAARNESGVKHGDLTMLVSNIRENGKLIGSLADGEMHFHSDYCYLEKPALGTFLYALEIPSQGGDTLFLNMHKAYDALSAELKAAIEGRKAVNAYHYESLTRSVNEARDRFLQAAALRAADGLSASGHRTQGALRQPADDLDGRRHGRGRRHRAAEQAVRAYRAGSIHLCAHMARRRPRPVGQPLHAARAHRLQ